MADASAPVVQLEKAYWQQFYYLVQAIGFFQALGKKYAAAKVPTTDQRWKNLENYGMKTLLPLAKKWYEFKIKLDKGGVKTPDVDLIKFFQPSYYPTLLKQVSAVNADKPTQGGIGFIPLLIWAVSAIYAMFTVKEIVAQVDSTTSQQKELVDSTNALCKANNLSPEECKNILHEQQQTIQTDNSNKEPGLFDSLKSLLLWGVGIFAVVKFGPELIKSTKKSAA